MSSAHSVNTALSDYLAGRVTAERLVSEVAAAYYRETTNGKRETWRLILDVAERVHPGTVELAASAAQPGFAVRPADRPFPKRYEAELRAAAQAVLQAQSSVPVSRVAFPEAPGWMSRMIAALRRVFTPSR
ncbi:MAG: hypothetical protein ACREMN_07205 [Gemmatimonadales bacterium]